MKLDDFSTIIIFVAIVAILLWVTSQVWPKSPPHTVPVVMVQSPPKDSHSSLFIPTIMVFLLLVVLSYLVNLAPADSPQQYKLTNPSPLAAMPGDYTAEQFVVVPNLAACLAVPPQVPLEQMEERAGYIRVKRTDDGCTGWITSTVLTKLP